MIGTSLSIVLIIGRHVAEHWVQVQDHEVKEQVNGLDVHTLLKVSTGEDLDKLFNEGLRREKIL